ncbi:MAG: glycosyltransferase family 4 protein [bacterium]
MRPLHILQILLSITETNASYGHLCLAWSGKHRIAICTYFRSRLTRSHAITLFEGDDSLRGFFRALKAALAAQDYDVIHAHSPHVGFLFVMANMLTPRKLIRGTVYTVHNSYHNYKLRNKLLMLPIFATFQRVVCCGEACLQSYPGFYKWLAGKRLCAIPNSVDISRVDGMLETASRHSPNGRYTVASVGRIIAIKNPLVVLSAFQQSADQASRVVFIGEGYLRDALVHEIKMRHLGEQVELTGLIPRRQVYERLSSVDLVVSASRGEGLPVAVIEAMACRCPVVLSDIAPHREIARGVEFIPLIPPDDVAGFARELRRFRGMPAAERAEIGEKCRRLVEERFSLAAMHRKYEEVYAQTMVVN